MTSTLSLPMRLALRRLIRRWGREISSFDMTPVPLWRVGQNSRKNPARMVQMSVQRHHKYMSIWLILRISAVGVPTIAQAEVHVEVPRLASTSQQIKMPYRTSCLPSRRRSSCETTRQCRAMGMSAASFGLVDARHFTPARWLRLRDRPRSRTNRACSLRRGQATAPVEKPVTAPNPRAVTAPGARVSDASVDIKTYSTCEKPGRDRQLIGCCSDGGSCLVSV
jgi:hypothetical protein